MSPQDLAAECQTVLDADAARIQRRDATLSTVRATESQRMSEAVSVRYHYTKSLIEAARHYRSQGLTADQAARKTPHQCSVGTTVSFESEGFWVVKRDEAVLGRVGHARFKKNYWPKAR